MPMAAKPVAMRNSGISADREKSLAGMARVLLHEWTLHL
jgi:hypothetical protein